MADSFETPDDSPVDLIFTKDTLEFSLDSPGLEYRDAGPNEQFLILDFVYLWTYQKSLRMSFRDKKTYQEEMEPMDIPDYQTAVDNLHDIMELYPECIPEDKKDQLLRKWKTFFTGLEESVFLCAEKEDFIFGCGFCEDPNPKPGNLEFELSYFPAVENSPLNKESIVVQEYTMCFHCGVMEGTKVMGPFTSFAYEALDMIEEILARNPFDYDDASPLEKAAEFIRNKTNY